MKSLETHVSSSSLYYTFTPSTVAQEYLLHTLCVGDFCYEAGYDLSRTTYGSYLLEVILEGEVQIETEGEALTAHEGQVVLIDCNKPHRYHSDTGWRALWVHFDGTAAPGYFNLILRQNNRAFFTHRQPIVYQALQAIYDMFDRQQPLSETEMALLLTQALTAMAEPAAPEATNERFTLINQAVALINRSIGHEPSVSQLARQVGLSEYHFIRVFNKVMGVTPRQYIITTRMNHARYLLSTTALPVSEIGSRMGYSSDSMFSAAFRRIHGLTPSACRARQPEKS